MGEEQPEYRVSRFADYSQAFAEEVFNFIHVIQLI